MISTLALLALVVQRPSLSAKIDNYVAPYVNRRDFSGVILVERGNKTLYRKAFGNANFEWKTPNNPESVFRIASLSKTFTAGAIYILEKAGKLGFEDKLSKYLPNFPKAADITIRQLLQHQSGVGAPDMDPYLHHDISLDQVIDLIATAPFQFEPGKDGSYSNSGYSILAKVIEIVSGKSYDDFLRTEFFKPLAMENTGDFLQSDFVPLRASPYFPGPPPSGVAPVAGFDELPYLGAGSLSSNAGDLMKWLRAVQSKRFYDIDKLDWPMGWGKRTYFGKRANEQTGISTGFTSGMIDFPNDDLRVVILSNVQTQFSSRALVEISGMVLGTDPQPLPAPKFVDIGLLDVARVLGKYTIDGKDKLEIFQKNGHLYYHWNQDADHRYLAPLGNASVYARDEFATWTWHDNGFTWDGPFGKMELKRVQT
jgi:CubicO group peptidase (beta-lactamase class C family)